MLKVYKITDSKGGGKCWCGHHHKRGTPYWLVDKGSRLYAFCYECGLRRKFSGASATIEQMMQMWFGGVKPQELLGKNSRIEVRVKQVKVKREVPVEAVFV